MGLALPGIARRINEAHRRATALAGEALGAARTAGELLLEAKDRVGHGGWEAWLGENFEGSLRTARDYMRICREWPAIEEAIAKRQHAADLSMRGALRALREPPAVLPHLGVLSSADDEWYTPREYVEAARLVMGGIDVDPATSAAAQEVIRATHAYTVEDDGLQHPWRGRLWLNPPWGRSCAEFVARAVAEFEAGSVTQAILLLNSNSNETVWFRPLWGHTLCFSAGRINFWGANEQAAGSTHGSVFVYLGSNWRAFAAAFRGFGNVVRRVVVDQ